MDSIGAPSTAETFSPVVLVSASLPLRFVRKLLIAAKPSSSLYALRVSHMAWSMDALSICAQACVSGIKFVMADPRLPATMFAPTLDSQAFTSLYALRPMNASIPRSCLLFLPASRFVYSSSSFTKFDSVYLPSL